MAPRTISTGRAERYVTPVRTTEEISSMEKEMRKAAQMLEYEYAAVLRDELIRLRGEKG